MMEETPAPTAPLRRGPDCLSELQLERLLAAELGHEARAQAELHLAGCAHCTQWLSEARKHETRLAARFPTDPFVDGVLDELGRTSRDTPESRSAWAPWLPRLAGGLAAASVATLAMVWMAHDRHDADSPHRGMVNTVRVKGGPALWIHRKRGPSIALAPRSATFRAGDALRFEVDPGASTHVLVLSIHAGGEVQCYYPMDRRKSGRLLSRQRQVLPDAVELQGTYDELIVALFSKRPLPIGTARAAARKAYARSSGELTGIHQLALDGVEQRVRLLSKEAVAR